MSTRSEPWRVDAVPEFTAWLSELDQGGQEKVETLIRLLERFGPTLGRPYADRLKGSRHHNLKELRPSSSQDEALRVLFYFDPERQALLLVGGDKSGNWKAWYDENVPIAEARIDRHEARLKEQAAEAARQGGRTTDKARRKGKKR